jgi:PhoH-like ATPase
LIAVACGPGGLPGSVIDDLFAGTDVKVDAVANVATNTAVILRNGSQSAITVANADGRLLLVPRRVNVFGLTSGSVEQSIAIEQLLNPDIGIVSIGGRAGTGKSTVALAAGLELVMKSRAGNGPKKIIVFRPMYSVGGQDLGFLPGTAEEKMSPWAQAVFDALAAFVTPAVMTEIQGRELIEVLPLTHIRGRSLHDTVVIVDEAQSLERNTLLTVLSRLGKNSKIVLTHDRAQGDNMFVGRHDGVATVIDKLKGEPLFAHITLTKSQRSPVADLVTRLLDGE